MSQTDNDKAGLIGIQIRRIFSVLDKAVYSLLIIIYQIFFNVASTTILQGDTLKAFFGRIQIILGIFVLFKLAINLLNVIVNPDQLGNDKSGQGFTQIVVRVVISLVMLVAVMPLNIPNAKPDSYEAHLNANGLLFGTLYEFQDRILEQNTLAKLILGSSTDNADTERDNMKEAGNQMATLVLKGFVRINLKKGKTDETDSENWMCPNDEDSVKAYLSNDATPSDILDMITIHCKSDDGERFVFTYSAIIGAIVGALFVIIIIGFTLDIAIRAIKLAVLRLISPIPIISYIDPKSSKDGAFASWTKAVMTTYLDLFLRLAIVYFVIFIIQDIMTNGIVIANHEGPIGTISVIFIFLGLLYFAKQAPRFITTTLGIKSAGLGGIGTSGALGFLGGLVGGGGLSGAAAGAMAAANTAGEAAAQGKAAPGGWSTGRDLATKLRTGDEKAVGGLLNNAQRHLMNQSKRAIGAARLRSMGISAEEADKAKTLMFQASDRAQNISSMRSKFEVGLGGNFNRFANRNAAGQLTTIDTSSNEGQLLKQFVDLHKEDQFVKDWMNGKDKNGNIIDDAAMMDYMVNASQTEYKKQEAYYKDADTLLKKYGNDLSLEDKYAGGINRYFARGRHPAAGKGRWSRYYGDQGHKKSEMDFQRGSSNNSWDDRTHTK